jgi:hypothetical protein
LSFYQASASKNPKIKTNNSAIELAFEKLET